MPVLLPNNLEEACDMLSENDGNVTPIAGGTDLLVNWPQRFENHGRVFLDLSHLEELKPIRWTENELVLGGLTTYWDTIQSRRVEKELPLLMAAARQIGAVQIQSRGTWAGNIVNASPAADGVPVLMAYDADVVLVSATGSERVPLDELYLGYKRLRMRSDQLIQEIRIPRREYSVEFFEKVGSRRAQAITKVGVAITHSVGGWRVVAISVAPTICRCPTLEKLLDDGDPISSFEDLLPAVREDVSPIDDIRSSAEYREQILARVIYHALRNACPSFE